MTAPRPEDHLEIVYVVANGVARDFPRTHPDELVAWGYEGLARACRSYDPERGPFEPYAATLVRNDILGGLRAWFGWRRVGRAGVRFERRRLEQIGRTDEHLEVDARLDVEQLLATLPARARHVVREHALRERRLRDVGADLGLSEARVCQIEREAFASMRASA